jgi:hypothetical protein
MLPLVFVSSLLALGAASVNGAVVGKYTEPLHDKPVLICLFQEKRQLQEGIYFFQSLAIARSLPRSNPVVTKLGVELFPNAVHERLVWGPFTLNPSNVRSKTVRWV